MEKKYEKPFDELSIPEKFMEIIYQRFLGVTKAAYSAINRAYPVDLRRSNPKTEYLYKSACAEAKGHLTDYKSSVRDFVLVFVQLKLHANAYDYIEDRPTQDLRKLIQSQFTMLHKRLKDHADIMVPKDHVEDYVKSLDKVFASELDYLLNSPMPTGIANFEAVPRFKTADEYASKIERDLGIKPIDLKDKIKKPNGEDHE
jgi:hypothetical protein